MRGRTAGFLALLAAIALGIAVWRWMRSPAPPSATAAPGPSTPAASRAGRSAVAGVAADSEVPSAPRGVIEGESEIAANLNAPAGSIQEDLSILNDVFDMWQSNFPREGNPVGENAEITAALAGENALHFAFIPRRHRAINAGGELCDRWGTPFRFHQLSGRQMEIRSAGPDRKFGTPDDAGWTPQ